MGAEGRAGGRQRRIGGRVPASERTETLRAETPHGELVLQLRAEPPGGASLILAGAFLMDSDLSLSEEELARRALAEIPRSRARRGLRALVAGLGLGLTLRELLRERAIAQVVVIELFAELVAWNRTRLSAINGHALADPRVSCLITDLREYLVLPPSGEPARFDLLLFDIDNGPTWLSLPGNAWLYSREGLEAVRRAVAPGGVAAFWASEPAPAFEAELEEMGLPWARECIVPPAGPGERRLEYTLYFVRPGVDEGEATGGA